MKMSSSCPTWFGSLHSTQCPRRLTLRRTCSPGSPARAAQRPYLAAGRHARYGGTLAYLHRDAANVLVRPTLLCGSCRLPASNRRSLLAPSHLAKERPDPKPSLDAVMSQAQLEKKVQITCAIRRCSRITGKGRSRPSNCRLRWIAWRSTPNSPRCCASSLQRSATIPLSSRSVWPGRCWRSV